VVVGVVVVVLVVVVVVPSCDACRTIECRGYRCSFENQKCLAGTPGSLGLNWVCKSNEWIQWIKG
jgi:hypothetical protein